MVNSKQLQLSNPNTDYRIVEHFLGNTPAGNIGFAATIGAGGAIGFLTGSLNAPGITRIQTGIQTTGVANLRYPLSFSPPGTTGRQNYHCNFRFRLPTNPVSATESCLWFLGFSNTGAAATEPTNGVYLYIDNNDGVMYPASVRTGARNYQIHAVTQVNAWLECRISLLRNGTARVRVQELENEGFSEYIWSAASGNVPTAALGLQFSVAKSAGTSSRQLDLDWVEIIIDNAPAP